MGHGLAISYNCFAMLLASEAFVEANIELERFVYYNKTLLWTR